MDKSSSYFLNFIKEKNALINIKDLKDTGGAHQLGEASVVRISWDFYVNLYDNPIGGASVLEDVFMGWRANRGP